MSEYDLNALKQSRDALLFAMQLDPKLFGAVLYQVITKGLFRRKRETFSPYFINNKLDLCCLIDKTDVPQAQWTTICKSKKTSVISTSKSGEVLKVENGQEYALKVVKIRNLGIEYQTSPPGNIKDVIRKLGNLSNCGYYDVTKLKYLASDTFTNELLISYWLDYYYDYLKPGNTLNGVLKVYDATICDAKNQSHGTFLTEYAQYHGLNSWLTSIVGSNSIINSTCSLEDVSVTCDILTKSTLIDLFKQLTANILFLQTEFQFNHGNLNGENILVMNTQNTFDYNNVKNNSNITFKMNNFEHSSMTVNIGTQPTTSLVRIYNKGFTSILTIFPFKPILGKIFSENYYQVDANFDFTTYTRIRHMGIPYFNSWDTYTLLLSLLSYREIFFAVFAEEQLRQVFFFDFFFIEDVSRVYKGISNAAIKDKPLSMNDIIGLLRGARLKCNATDTLFERLKTLT